MQLPGNLMPQRLFCIGCNYDAHIKELGNCDADRCVVFMKPASCLVADGEPIVIPRDRGAVHHEVELVVVIGKEGRDIPTERARDHVGAVALGLDMTLRDVQTRLKQHGHPWEQCKAFDYGAPLGNPVPFGPDLDLGGIDMVCTVNQERRQNGNTRDMLFSVEQLIEILSRLWRLLPGDLIYTGTPPGVGPVVPGDTITVESPQLGCASWPVA